MQVFIFPLRIYVEDTDFGGVVYHANYLNFFERARSEWAEQLGWGVNWQKEQQMYFPVRSASLEYLKPARLGEECEVVSQVIKVRKASLIYDQYLRHKSVPDTMLCRAQIKIACVGLDFQPRPLPKTFTNFITENTRDV